MTACLLLPMIFLSLLICGGAGAISCTIDGDYEKLEGTELTRITIFAGRNITIRCQDNQFAKILFEKHVGPNDPPCLRNRVVQNYTVNHASLYIDCLFEEDRGLYMARAPLAHSSEFDYNIFINVTRYENFYLSTEFYEHESTNASDCSEVPRVSLICAESECLPKHLIPSWAHPIILLVLAALVLGLVIYAVYRLVRKIIRMVRERKAENVVENGYTKIENEIEEHQHDRFTPMLKAC